MMAKAGADHRVTVPEDKGGAAQGNSRGSSASSSQEEDPESYASDKHGVEGHRNSAL